MTEDHRDNRDPQVIGLLIKRERVGTFPGPAFPGRPSEIADRILSDPGLQIPDHGTPEALEQLGVLVAGINGQLKPVVDAIRAQMERRLILDRIFAYDAHGAAVEKVSRIQDERASLGEPDVLLPDGWRSRSEPTHALDSPPRLTEDDVDQAEIRAKLDLLARQEADRVMSYCPECRVPRTVIGPWRFCENEECPRYEEPVR